MEQGLEMGKVVTRNLKKSYIKLKNPPTISVPDDKTDFKIAMRIVRQLLCYVYKREANPVKFRSLGYKDDEEIIEMQFKLKSPKSNPITGQASTSSDNTIN